MAAALEVIYRFVQEGKVLGPFPGKTRFCPITGHPLFFYPSFVVPKSTPGSFRWVLNASYSQGGPSINDRIFDYSTSLIDVKTSLLPCVRSRFMARIDLTRAFKQLFRSIEQMYLLATVVGENVFIDATMSMGLRNTCKLFEEDFMKAFVKGLVHHHPDLFSDNMGNLVDSYLDDIWFLANTREKNMLQLLVAEYWASWLGIQLNYGKRKLPSSEVQHLGFEINLARKVVLVTQKHRSRVSNFFDQFLIAARKNQRISIKSIQKMLGLQIWISTVFRVARQFLTSVCDLLRVTYSGTYFYPRKHPALVARTVKDLKFWRRFVSGKATASFDYLLCRLPPSKERLSSDASTSYGMSGVILFHVPHRDYPGFDGLFWQQSWKEWERVFSMTAVKPGAVKINAAEFLAMLITCETFTDLCAGKLTYLEVDNTCAQAWFEAARCPLFPFDRCAQGTHLHMLDYKMKVKTRWVSSSDNILADRCSREKLHKDADERFPGDVRMLKVKPRWQNVMKFM